MEWNSTDLDDLTNAVGLLENPGLIAKVSDVVGTPIEYVLKALPKGAGDKITKVTHDSLLAAVNLAVKTIDPRGRSKPRSRSPRALRTRWRPRFEWWLPSHSRDTARLFCTLRLSPTNAGLRFSRVLVEQASRQLPRCWTRPFLFKK